jgi:hypothetical protein
MVILTEAQEQVDSNSSHRTSVGVGYERLLGCLFLLFVPAYSNEVGQITPDARIYPFIRRLFGAGWLLGITLGHTLRNCEERLLLAGSNINAATPEQPALAAHSLHWQERAYRLQLGRDLCLLNANQASSLDDFRFFLTAHRAPSELSSPIGVGRDNQLVRTEDLATLNTN